MRPFKMFFGLAIGIMLFLFLARIVFIAFIAAAVMSIVYAIYRRLKDFITYDRFGEYYMQGYHKESRLNSNWKNEVEPLFYDSSPRPRSPIDNVQFIKAI